MRVGNVALPSTARLHALTQTVQLQPLEFVDLVHIPSGAGMLFLTTMQVQSGNFNFMEHVGTR